MQSSMILKYPILTILSRGKRSFENMGRVIKKSGDTVRRLLCPSEESLEKTRQICKEMFKKKKKLYVIIDDTLIKKFHSRFMQGTGWFFDTKIGRRIMAYRFVTGLITDGKISIPIDCAYLFSKELVELCKVQFPTKDDNVFLVISKLNKTIPLLFYLLIL